MSSLKQIYRTRLWRVELGKHLVLERAISSSVAQKQKLIRFFLGNPGQVDYFGND